MAIFQVAFGLAVFAATRYYYRDAPKTTTVTAAILDRPWSALPLDASGTSSSTVDAITENVIASGDPIEISRLADERFTAREYDSAARLYAELLRLAPDHADTYNNLGLTLHYLGRSDEALDILNQGVAAEPTHQRIWLTLGFVNSQIGDIEQARTALKNATEMGDDADIRQSARDMLEQLP
jgi:tetratricopeptide (TPR) repeat protein